MSVGSLITEGYKIHNLKNRDLKMEADRLLKLVGLPSQIKERYPHQLSGGQARRVGVARAISLDPKMISADEPTAGLDVSVQGEILNLQIGFSHDVNFKIPKEIKITVEKQTIIKINGVDKELVSKIAADIKNLKPVEPYKAKGIKEKGQFVLRKEGKKK